jgi:hypothetical protein
MNPLTLSNFSTLSWRTLNGSAAVLPALSGILRDGMERAPTSHTTGTCVVRRRHAGASVQNTRAPQS